ncbi:MAG: DNA cytosine methyltransferase [Victivallales bacterium]|nr:DNA cytosine methyltransferase [Victivallales bacterium]
MSTTPGDQLSVCEPAEQLDFLKSLMADNGQTFQPFSTLGQWSMLDILQQNAVAIPREITHVDCFSGVGGFCTGLQAAGLTTRVALEKVQSCVDTYVANHPSVHVIRADIRDVTAQKILPFCPKEGIDLVTSGMPCETFSTAGNTSRSFYDDRQFLFREGIRIAQIVNAKFLLFENVPGITSKTVGKNDPTRIVDILKKEMRQAGYGNFIEVILDAAHFGVPQHRRRFFLLGTRFPKVRLSPPLPCFPNPLTVEDALAGLPPVQPNSWQEGREYQENKSQYAALMRNLSFWRIGQGEQDELTYHMPMKHRPATLERFTLLQQGESLKDLFAKCDEPTRLALQERRVLPRQIFIKRNYRLKPGLPSPTVTSHCLDEFVHPTEHRALTVRECARLQSFPDSYRFEGGPYIVPHINREVQDKYEQIGDAVPPLLAFAWGKAIIQQLLQMEKKNERHSECKAADPIHIQFDIS